MPTAARGVGDGDNEDPPRFPAAFRHFRFDAPHAVLRLHDKRYCAVYVYSLDVSPALRSIRRGPQSGRYRFDCRRATGEQASTVSNRANATELEGQAFIAPSRLARGSRGVRPVHVFKIATLKLTPMFSSGSVKCVVQSPQCFKQLALSCMGDTPTSLCIYRLFLNLGDSSIRLPRHDPTHRSVSARYVRHIVYLLNPDSSPVEQSEEARSATVHPCILLFHFLPLARTFGTIRGQAPGGNKCNVPYVLPSPIRSCVDHPPAHQIHARTNGLSFVVNRCALRSKE